MTIWFELTQQSIRDQLGRDPSTEEVQAYIDFVNANYATEVATSFMTHISEYFAEECVR